MPTNTDPLKDGQNLTPEEGYQLPAEYDIEYFTYYAHVFAKGTKRLLGTALVDGDRIVDFRAGVRLSDQTPNVEFGKLVNDGVIPDPDPEEPDPEEPPPPVTTFRMLAVSNIEPEGGPVYVYKTNDWSLLHTVPSFPQRQATAARFSPNGEILAVAYEYDEQPVVSPNIQLVVNIQEIPFVPEPDVFKYLMEFGLDGMVVNHTSI